MVFGSETWAMAGRDVTRLGTWKRRILRTVHGPVVEQGVWRIKINQELRELYKELDIAADIRKKRLEWDGDKEEIGMGWRCSKNGQGRAVQKTSESKPEESKEREDLD